jgi:hypothetical protein
MKEQSASVKALSLLVVTLALYLLLWQILTLHFSFPVYYYGRLIELLATLLFAALAILTPMRFEEMGIVTSRQTLFRSLAIGGVVALATVAICALLSLQKGATPLFSWHIRGDISRITYFAVAPFQEILGKSVLLCTLESCFDGKHPHLANLLAALVFGAFHVVYGLRMMLLAMALSFVTGLLFLRHRSVWGCAVAHFSLGFFPVCFGLA